MKMLKALKELGAYLHGEAVLLVDGNDFRKLEEELRDHQLATCRIIPGESYPDMGQREVRYYAPNGVVTVRRLP